MDKEHNGKKSVLDYVITTKEDAPLNKKMEIDERKEKTPYWLNEEKEIIYSDHCMITLESEIILKNKKEETKKNIGEKGYKRYKEKLQENKISSIIKEENFSESYTKWNDEINNIIEECSTKKKKSKGWKVNRKLLVAKKSVTRELRKPGLDKETIRLYKIRKNYHFL